MSRKLDWDKVRAQKMVSGPGEWMPASAEFEGPYDAVAWATTPTEARNDFLALAAAAALANRAAPAPPAAFIKYFGAEIGEDGIEGWIIRQPEFQDALRKRLFKAKQQRAEYLAKLAEIDRLFHAPPVPPVALSEIPAPQTPDQIWEWARRQPEYALLKKKKPNKGRFKVAEPRR